MPNLARTLPKIQKLSIRPRGGKCLTLCIHLLYLDYSQCNIDYWSKLCMLFNIYSILSAWSVLNRFYFLGISGSTVRRPIMLLASFLISGVHSSTHPEVAGKRTVFWIERLTRYETKLSRRGLKRISETYWGPEGSNCHAHRTRTKEYRIRISLL
jgi:hypothetical protein